MSKKTQRTRTAHAAATRPAGGTATAPAASAPRRDVTPIKVRALKLGYSGEKLRHEGDVFLLEPVRDEHGTLVATPEEIFSSKWMQRVDRRTPIRESGPQDEIDRHRQTTLAERAAGGSAPGILTQDEDDIPTGSHAPLGD